MKFTIISKDDSGNVFIDHVERDNPREAAEWFASGFSQHPRIIAILDVDVPWKSLRNRKVLDSVGDYWCIEGPDSGQAQRSC
jgi:hypothetical protein